MPTYSLSSATDPACISTKKKRVSAQLSSLMGASRNGSRVSSEDSRRGISEDRMACSNNRMSKAAAWMWHARGIEVAAVVPTKQPPPAVNASSIINTGLQARTASMLQPSRFKQEANTRLASDQAASASSLVHDTVKGKIEERPSATVNDLYDEFEVSRLQELLDTEIDKRRSHLSAQPTSRKSASFTVSSSSRQIKPLSAIHKLFTKLYTAVHNINTRNSAIEITGRPSTGILNGPRRLDNVVQHVIHHHHYHYDHHYRSSMDLPAHDLLKPDQSLIQKPTHLQEFARRRRHSYQDYNQFSRCSNSIVDFDNLVDEYSVYTEDSAHHCPQRLGTSMRIEIKGPSTNDDLRPVPEMRGGGGLKSPKYFAE